jgi:hypothetical protein
VRKKEVKMTDKFLTKEERDKIITKNFGIWKVMLGNMSRLIIPTESMTPDLLKKSRKFLIKVRRADNMIDEAIEKLNTCKTESEINSILMMYRYQYGLNKLFYKIIDERAKILDEIEGKRS